MAKIYTYRWAIGKWENRENLAYVASDKIPTNLIGVSIQNSGFHIPENRIPYKMEDVGNGVYYVTYSSADNAPIIKITEE